MAFSKIDTYEDKKGAFYIYNNFCHRNGKNLGLDQSIPESLKFVGQTICWIELIKHLCCWMVYLNISVICKCTL